MREEFLSFVSEQELWTTNDRLLLAASGGIDSMVLAHLLSTSSIPFAIAHVNYQLRGLDSDADEALVHATGTKLNCKVHLTKVTINKEKENVQEQARALRYAFFDELCTEFGYTKILTAHHADDQIETMLLNLIRGTGIKGFGGIPLKNKNVVRPMLWASKAQITKYAQTAGVAFRHDQSNDTNDYTRNRIRNEVLPLLQNIDPNVKAKLQASQKLLHNDYLALTLLARQKLKFIGEDLELILEDLERPGWAGIIYHAFRWTGLSFAQAVEATTADVGAHWICNGWKLIRSKGHLSAINIHKDETEEKQLSFGVVNIWCGHKIEVGHYPKNQQPVFDVTNRKVWLSLPKSGMPMSIRLAKPDDIFKPLGMSYDVNLKKYLLEKGASYASIANVYVVLTSDNKICWVPLWQVSEDFKWKFDNDEIVYLSFVPNGDEIRLSRKTIPRL